MYALCKISSRHAHGDRSYRICSIYTMSRWGNIKVADWGSEQFDDDNIFWKSLNIASKLRIYRLRMENFFLQDIGVISLDREEIKWNIWKILLQIKMVF